MASHDAVDDPTLPPANGGSVEPNEFVWMNKRWQQYKGQRARAIINASDLGHQVIIAMQPLPSRWAQMSMAAEMTYFEQARRRLAATGRKPCDAQVTTSFPTWSDFETWEQTVTQHMKNFFELLTIIESRPYFDIDADLSEIAACEGVILSPELVAKDSIDGLRDLFQAEYGLNLEPSHFLVSEACTRSKISFHLLIVNCTIDRLDLKLRLVAAKAADHRLRFVDTAPYGKTQAFRCLGSHKRGKVNYLRAVANVGDYVLHPVDGLTIRHFCASYRTGDEQLLHPLRPSNHHNTGGRDRRGRVGPSASRAKKAKNVVDGEDIRPHESDEIEARCVELLQQRGDTSEFYTWIDDETLYFRTPAGGRTCVNGCRHDSNNSVVKVDKEGNITFRCFSQDPRCRGKWVQLGKYQRKCTWQVPPDQIVEPIIDPTTGRAKGFPRKAVTAPLESVQVWRAQMGIGKSEAGPKDLKDFCRTFPDASAIVIAPLRALCSEHYKKHYSDLGFAFYESILDVPITARRVVVCANSLIRLEDLRYDWVIVDEPNKIFENLLSMGARAYNVWSRLVLIIRHARRCLILDAAADDKVRLLADAALSVVPGRAPAYWVDVAYKTHVGRKVDFVFSDSDEPGVRRIIGALRAGLNVAVAATSCVDAVALHKRILTEFPEGIENAIITGDTPDAERDRIMGLFRPPESPFAQTMLQTGNFPWPLPRLFIYTSVLSVGNSIVCRHFHMIFLRVTPNTVSGETTKQMVERIRLLINDIRGEVAVVVLFDSSLQDPEQPNRRWEHTKISRADVVDELLIPSRAANTVAKTEKVLLDATAYPGDTYYLVVYKQCYQLSPGRRRGWWKESNVAAHEVDEGRVIPGARTILEARRWLNDPNGNNGAPGTFFVRPEPKATYRFTRKIRASLIPIEVVHDNITTNLMYDLARCAAGPEWRPSGHSDWDHLVKETFPAGLDILDQKMDGLDDYNKCAAAFVAVVATCVWERMNCLQQAGGALSGPLLQGAGS